MLLNNNWNKIKSSIDGGNRIIMKQGAANKLPFDDNSFDITISIHNMEHSYAPKKSLGEMFRVTKEGGLFCIEVPVCFETSETDRTDFKNLLTADTKQAIELFMSLAPLPIR